MPFYIFLIVFGLGVRCARGFWPPAYKVDLNDRKVFVIASEEADYDEESEDEMIRAEDLAEFKTLSQDDEKFEPLHSHVERYNKLSARTATEFADVFPNEFEPSLEEIHNFVEEAKPFVAGFKHELDAFDFDDLEERVFKAVRKKRNVTEDFAPTTNGEIRGEASPPPGVEEKTILTTPLATENGVMRETHKTADQEEETKNEGGTTESDNTDTDGRDEDELSNEEEDYDYEQLKAEYYEHIESMKKENGTFNYTDNGEPEETAEDAIKKIVDFKMPRNCTEEELTQFGAKALECLAYDYKNAKDNKSVKNILSRTWLVIRIWIFVYLFIAIPCWCQKGWCCCCLNCAFCNPGESIETAKKYYAQNPPGILTEDGGEDEPKITEFEPTLFELEAFEKFESAIRNL